MEAGAHLQPSGPRGNGLKALRQEHEADSEAPAHALTHYEPSGFGLLGPLLPSLRAADFGTASPC